MSIMTKIPSTGIRHDQSIRLYKEAYAWAVEKINPEFRDTTAFQGIVVGRFAELIVLECAKICAGTAVTNPPNDLLEGYNLGVNKAAENIKQHFGVDE
jgi:hypothetical protein